MRAEHRPQSPANKLVTVFGGTGFLGNRVVEACAEKGWSVRVATRNPDRHGASAGSALHGIEFVEADVQDKVSTANAAAGAWGIVNCVGLYVQTRDATFETVHALGAENVASAASESGVAGLVHISGIGADLASKSHFVRTRAKGEQLVRAAYPNATILRPSVMFGPGGDVFTMLADISRRLPILPLFGSGNTRLQPVYVGDVAGAVAAALEDVDARGRRFDLGGPDIYRYKDMVSLVLKQAGRRRLLLPLPFAIWSVMARLADMVLPNPPISPAQVALMRRDNIAAEGIPQLDSLGIVPTSARDILPGYVN